MAYSLTSIVRIERLRRQPLRTPTEKIQMKTITCRQNGQPPYNVQRGLRYVKCINIKFCIYFYFCDASKAKIQKGLKNVNNQRINKCSVLGRLAIQTKK